MSFDFLSGRDRTARVPPFLSDLRVIRASAGRLGLSASELASIAYAVGLRLGDGNIFRALEEAPCAGVMRLAGELRRLETERERALPASFSDEVPS